MTQPTIAELREMAELERTQAMFDGHAATVMIIDAFLRYTDDRPLTESDYPSITTVHKCGNATVSMSRVHVPVESCLNVESPHRGLVAMALDLERERAAK